MLANTCYGECRKSMNSSQHFNFLYVGEKTVFAIQSRRGESHAQISLVAQHQPTQKAAVLVAAAAEGKKNVARLFATRIPKSSDKTSNARVFCQTTTIALAAKCVSLISLSLGKSIQRCVQEREESERERTVRRKALLCVTLVGWMYLGCVASDSSSRHIKRCFCASLSLCSTLCTCHLIKAKGIVRESTQRRVCSAACNPPRDQASNAFAWFAADQAGSGGGRLISPNCGGGDVNRENAAEPKGFSLLLMAL